MEKGAWNVKVVLALVVVALGQAMNVTANHTGHLNWETGVRLRVLTVRSHHMRNQKTTPWKVCRGDPIPLRKLSAQACEGRPAAVAINHELGNYR